MEKKSTKSTPSAPADTSLMQKAGEVLSSIGSHIVEAKDAVTDTVVKEFKVVKKAIKKKLAKKTAKKSAPKKAAPKKATSKFTGKARKAAKKSASNRLKK